MEESVLSLCYACSYLILLDSLPKAKSCCRNVYFGQSVHDEEQPAGGRAVSVKDDHEKLLLVLEVKSSNNLRDWLRPGLGVGVEWGACREQTRSKVMKKTKHPAWIQALTYIIRRVLGFSVVNDVGFRITET